MSNFVDAEGEKLDLRGSNERAESFFTENTMVSWTLRFGPSPAGVAWIVEREDGAGPTLVCAPEAYEEARSELVRRALADDGEAVQLLVTVDDGVQCVVRDVLDS